MAVCGICAWVIQRHRAGTWTSGRRCCAQVDAWLTSGWLSVSRRRTLSGAGGVAGFNVTNMSGASAGRLCIAGHPSQYFCLVRQQPIVNFGVDRLQSVARRLVTRMESVNSTMLQTLAING